MTASEAPKTYPPLVITRVLQAPPATVFRAWSSAEHMRRWFAPECYTVPEAEIDFRPGGVCDICMRSPEGHDFWSRGKYLEISPPRRLVFTSAVVVGDVRRFEAHTTVTFEDATGGTTRLQVEQIYQVFDPDFEAAIKGAPEGWRTTLDKLEKEVARIAEQEGAMQRSAVFGHFRLERTYPVPAARVFRALSDLSAKSAWFASGEGLEVLERSMDFRVGGRERVQARWTNGTVSTFDAVYQDIVPNQRVIYSYQLSIDDRKISVSLTTFQLSPEGAGTRLVFDEQGAYLDGYDDAGSRERGTGMLLDRLGASLND